MGITPEDRIKYETEDRYLEWLQLQHPTEFRARLNYRHWLDGIEEDWRAKQKSELPSSLLDWLDVFPEAKGIAKAGLRDEIKFYSAAERDLYKELQSVKNEGAFANGAKLVECEWLESITNDRIKDAQLILRRLRWQLDAIDGRNVPSGVGITEQDKDAARRVPIIDFVQHKRQGKNYVTKCIFHNDSHPSLTIFPDNRFKCFACDAHGDSIDFIKKLQGLEFIDAVKWILNK